MNIFAKGFDFLDRTISYRTGVWIFAFLILLIDIQTNPTWINSIWKYIK